MPTHNRIIAINQQEPFTVPSTFTRSSVAYDVQGNQVPVDTPRFSMYTPTGTVTDGLLVEESTTNLLTSADLTTLAGGSPVTIAVTNGTVYTVSLQNNPTINITLSGAGTGTVNYSNPVTITASGTSLTLTPSGVGSEPFMCQVEAKAYYTSWVTGGITRAPESCTIPSSVLNKNVGTISCDVYFKAQPVPNSYIISSQENEASNRMEISIGPDMKPRILFYRETGLLNLCNAPEQLFGKHQLVMSYDTNSAILYVDGVKKCTVENPYLPTNLHSLIVIGTNHWNNTHLNTIINNVTISNIKRTPTDIANRATDGYVLDRFVTAQGILKENTIFKGMCRV